jgi:hypothetical protein
VLRQLKQPFEATERKWLAEWKAEKKRRREAAKEEGSQPEAEPLGPPPRCLLDQYTVEAMLPVLANNPRGLAVVKPELVEVATAQNMYREGRGNDRQVLLQLWDHETIRIDRKSNPDGAPVVVSDPFAAFVGGIQPAVLTRLRGTGPQGETVVDDGYFDRFLLAYPVELPELEE